MRVQHCVLLLAFLCGSACGVPPRAREIVATDGVCLDAGSVGVHEQGPLRQGDRLVYECISRLDGSTQHAEVWFEIGELGRAGESIVVSDDASSVLDQVVEQWNASAGDQLIRHVESDVDLELCSGEHAVDVHVVVAGDVVRSTRVSLPIVCEGRGFWLAALRMRAHRGAGKFVLSSNELLELLLDCLPGLVLEEAAGLMRTVPGLDRVDRLAAMPSLLRLAFSRWELDAPFWDAVPVGEARCQFPLLLRCGAQPVVAGLVECGPAQGIACVTGGVVGLRVWHPGTTDRDLTLRLIRVERGPEVDVSPSESEERSVARAPGHD